MSARRKMRPSIRRYSAAAGEPVIITLPVTTAEYTITAVDASDVPIAFALGYGSGSVPRWPFTAGQSWTEDDLCLEAPHVLNVLTAANGVIVVATWDG